MITASHSNDFSNVLLYGVQLLSQRAPAVNQKFMIFANIE
jgi:hypothetical protein